MTKVTINDFSIKTNSKAFRAFNYIVVRTRIAAGSELSYTIEGGPRSQSNSVALYTQGRFDVFLENDLSQPTTTILPGKFNLDTADYKSGNFTFCAIEDTEWWCIELGLNKNQRPNVTPFRLAQGETVHLVQGTRLFICKGDLEIGDKIKSSTANIKVVLQDGVQVKAQNQVYGLVFN